MPNGNRHCLVPDINPLFNLFYEMILQFYTLIKILFWEETFAEGHSKKWLKQVASG